MSEAVDPGLQDPPVVTELAGDGPTEALNSPETRRFDPVRFRYIEAVARRSAAHSGELRQVLDRRVREAAAAYDRDFRDARSRADSVLSRAVDRYPESAAELQRLFRAGDFGGVQRLSTRLDDRRHARPLAELVRYIDRVAAEDPASPAHDRNQPLSDAPAELKALRQHRSAWAQLNVERQLARSLDRAPEKPGPLNSHLLVLRALQCMQQISPAYLVRFVTQVDTLLQLERLSRSEQPQAAKTARRESDRKPVRGRRSGRV